MSKIRDIIDKVAQYRDETLEKPDYMEPLEAEQATLKLIDEAVGEYENPETYFSANRQWDVPEPEEARIRNELRQEIRKKVGL